MNSLTVSITRDILARSYRCGTENEIDMIGNHCPIALALQEKFPDVFVSGTHIHLFGDERDEDFALPQEAIEFIQRFDSLADTPEERMGLPELTFKVALREEVVIGS
jgi:hypothetical protein